MNRDHDGENDDELLRALGARGRTERQHLSELERLATPAAGAENASPGGGDDAGADEVFAPFDAATRARFVDVIGRATARSSAEDAGQTVLAATPVSPLSAHPRFGARRRAVIFAAAGTLAAAAAFVLVVRSPGPALSYALEISGGDERQRAGDQRAPELEVPVLTATSWLEIRARPARPTGGASAWAFVRAQGGGDAGARVVAAPEVSADGVVRWRGTAAALLGNRRGTIEVRVVVGTGAPPAVEDVFASDGPAPGQALLTGRVQVRP